MPSADVHPFTAYNSTTIYIVDDKNPDEESRDDRMAARLCRGKTFNEHDSKCDLMRSFFKACTDYEVKGVYFPSGSTLSEFSTYWGNELSTKGAGDLVVIYYHGRAGGNGEDYTW